VETKKFKGLRNTTSDERFPAGFLEEADNLDIDNTGKVLERDAIDQLASGVFHSVWSDGDICLVMRGAELNRVNADFGVTAVVTLTSSAPMSYARQRDVVLLTNGTDTLMLRSGAPRPWGTPVPAAPAASASWGALPAGTYLYAVTYRRADGKESGASEVGAIELTEPGGIIFSGLEDSTDPGVRGKMVYLSAPNGEELFAALEVPAGEDSGTYREVPRMLGHPITTQHVSPPPAGSIVEIYNGSAVVVVGDTAYYSDPYSLEDFRLDESYLQFPGEITMFAAVNDGVFVGTREKVWFLSGGHLSQVSGARIALDYGVVPGTAAKASTGVLSRPGEDGSGTRGGAAVVWTSPRGVCVGMDGGEVVNLTELNYSFPTAVRGRGIVRQARGITQYLVALEDAGSAVNAYN